MSDAHIGSLRRTIENSTGRDDLGRVYKMTLEGKILGMLGESGRQLGRFHWPHGSSFQSEDTIYIADLNNWLAQKTLLYESTDSSGE